MKNISYTITLLLVIIAISFSSCAIVDKAQPFIDEARQKMSEAIAPASSSEPTSNNATQPEDKKPDTDIQDNETIIYNNVPLKVIKEVTGDSTKIISVQADKSPIVVYTGYTPTSQIKSSITFYWQGDTIYKQAGDLVVQDRNGEYWFTLRQGKRSAIYLIEDTQVKLKVESSGYKWWVKFCIEK